MSSPVQIAANQRNAELSTGPKTSEGKQVSSQNACKHGLLADGALVLGEDPHELDEFGEGIERDLKPQGDLEHSLVARIVGLLWRLRRAGKLEAAVLWFHSTPLLKKYDQPKDMYGEFTIDQLKRGESYIQAADSLAKLSRYESSIQRNLLRMMHELQRLQAARKGEHVPAPSVCDLDITGLPELRGTGDERG
jgi:hypothetical protein